MTAVVPSGGGYFVLLDIILDETDEYAGGIARVGGKNYHILDNSSRRDGNDPSYVHLATTQPPAVGSDIEIFPDDDSSTRSQLPHFRRATITKVTATGDRAVLETSTLLNAIEPERWLGGTVQVGERYYKIEAVEDLTLAGEITGTAVTISLDGKPLPQVDDRFTILMNLGAAVPVPRLGASLSPAEMNGMFALLDPVNAVKTSRLNNRFADAYIEPEYAQLS